MLKSNPLLGKINYIGVSMVVYSMRSQMKQMSFAHFFYARQERRSSECVESPQLCGSNVVTIYLPQEWELWGMASGRMAPAVLPQSRSHRFVVPFPTAQTRHTYCDTHCQTLAYTTRWHNTHNKCTDLYETFCNIKMSTVLWYVLFVGALFAMEQCHQKQDFKWKS